MATNKSIEHSDNTLDDYPHGASITSTLALFRFGQGLYRYLSFALALLFGGSFLLMASAKILGHIVESVTRQQESGTSLLLLSISFLRRLQECH